MIYVAARHLTATQFDAMLWHIGLGYFAVRRRLAVAANLAERLSERERATICAKRATNRFWSRLRV